MSNVIKLRVPFKSKTYDQNIKTHEKAFYKGKFIILIDLDYELILNVQLKIDELGIDVYNTCAWFKKDLLNYKKKDSFNIRKDFLKLSNVEIKPRFYKKECMRNDIQICDSFHPELIQKSQNQVIYFSKNKSSDIEKLRQFENWFNDYKISFKNLDKIATGSNPSGSVKKPNHNPIILDTSDHDFNQKYHNFSFIFEKLRLNKKREIDITKFLNKKAIDFVELEKKQKMPFILQQIFIFSNQISSEEKKTKIRRVKNNKKIAETTYIGLIKIFKVINKKRTIFSKNMDSIIDSKPNVKNYLPEYEKAHIKPVKHIKKQAIDQYLENKTYTLDVEKLLNDIADVNNGIFLKSTHHKYFDRGDSYIDPNDGKMYFNPKWKKAPILVIKEECLNDERVKFIKYHKKHIYGKGI